MTIKLVPETEQYLLDSIKRIGTAGLLSVIPGLHDVAIVFGLTTMIWFAWVGVVLLMTKTDRSLDAASAPCPA